MGKKVTSLSSQFLAIAMLLLGSSAAIAQSRSGDRFRDYLGPHMSTSQSVPESSSLREGQAQTEPVHRWNAIALHANAKDHTPLAAGETRTFGEQLGPGRTSRAFAIVQIAVFEAINAASGGAYQSYAGLPPASGPTSSDAAVAQAAHDALVALYPSQIPQFDNFLREDLNRIPEGFEKTNGISLGQQAAAAILAKRANDGSNQPDAHIGVDFIPSDQPGKWRPDPISKSTAALGVHWGDVQPFVVDSVDQFPLPAPPALTSPEYTAAFNEVKRLGGDGIHTPTERTPAQTVAGTFWAYDGTPGLGTPPRFYNRIILKIADQRGTSPLELARLLALANVAMADASFSCWHDKYVFQFWRPVTAIRESDPGKGPTGLGDGNPDTVGDPTFTPLGSPASNLTGPNFTPPFPSYASGHSTFGGALFEMLRDYYGTDAISFTIVSDEFNGVTRDNTGHVRPRLPRSFATLSQAENENGWSRIYLGVHWAFDRTAADTQGREVADYVFQHAFLRK